MTKDKEQPLLPFVPAEPLLTPKEDAPKNDVVTNESSSNNGAKEGSSKPEENVARTPATEVEEGIVFDDIETDDDAQPWAKKKL